MRRPVHVIGLAQHSLGGNRVLSVGRTLRWMRGQLFERSGLNRLARRRLHGDHAAVLMYHRVLPFEEARRLAVEPAMYVTPEAFELQLKALLSADFQVMPLHTICHALAVGRRLPKRAIALSFDDGWRDNYEYAAPALARLGCPATIFVVANRIDTDGAFWPDEVARRLGPLAKDTATKLVERVIDGPVNGEPLETLLAVLKTLPVEAREVALGIIREETRSPASHGRELMTWPELDELSRAGIDIESHGATHALFDQLDDATLRIELEGALATLRAHGHGRHGLVAYPSGAYDDRVLAATRLAGYQAAVTTERGLAGMSSDPFAIPRLGVHQDIGRSRAEFLQKVPGW